MGNWWKYITSLYIFLASAPNVFSKTCAHSSNLTNNENIFQITFWNELRPNRNWAKEMLHISGKKIRIMKEFLKSPATLFQVQRFHHIVRMRVNSNAWLDYPAIISLSSRHVILRWPPSPSDHQSNHYPPADCPDLWGVLGTRSPFLTRLPVLLFLLQFLRGCLVTVK